MKKFGSFEDVFKAHEAYDSFCDEQGVECENCKYDLLSSITGVPCSFFWVLDNCFEEKQKKPGRPSKEMVKVENDSEKMRKRILAAFRNMMDVMGGKRPSESISEFSNRKNGVLMNADELIGELEDSTTQRS